MSKPKIAFMFSGQGSQYFQMGQRLYQRQRVFRHWMDRLDGTVRQSVGLSVVDALYHQQRGKADSFDRTLLSHPAIFMVEYSLAQALLAEQLEPDILIGASLGTFVAAAVAGCVDCDQALTMLLSHAQVLEAHCERGAMIAVLANARLYDELGLSSYGELAAINFDSHFVISTSMSGALEVERILNGRNVLFQRLPVSFAFHSAWLETAERWLDTHLQTMPMAKARIPIACCMRAGLVESVAGDHLPMVMRKPIQFQKTIEYLETTGPYEYVDVGPSGTLATFVKYVYPPGSTQSRTHVMLTPFDRDLENFSAVVETLAAHRSFAI
ncbi:acyltransferase domain-containing protein [Chromobacterium sphagni]|uniref:Malonyl CoA-ACP transacylase n=1 Tax=Chromobacterium sphagni TaxID=1903179 RepID=A0A1S1X629_9NEIS|nr:acyltransferase domain-containing protein [Chromobacterium sphagni]OHX14636.1 malonyl CoA-ACP transacylase [Chromobacterium sphagni]OHX20699.1 malonyl CoA-ACP transacylase [Chromobacterium sphagni]